MGLVYCSQVPPSVSGSGSLALALALTLTTHLGAHLDIVAYSASCLSHIRPPLLCLAAPCPGGSLCPPKVPPKAFPGLILPVAFPGWRLPCAGICFSPFPYWSPVPVAGLPRPSQSLAKHWTWLTVDVPCFCTGSEKPMSPEGYLWGPSRSAGQCGSVSRPSGQGYCPLMDRTERGYLRSESPFHWQEYWEQPDMGTFHPGF